MSKKSRNRKSGPLAVPQKPKGGVCSGAELCHKGTPGGRHTLKNRGKAPLGRLLLLSPSSPCSSCLPAGRLLSLELLFHLLLLQSLRGSSRLIAFLHLVGFVPHLCAFIYSCTTLLPGMSSHLPVRPSLGQTHAEGC